MTTWARPRATGSIALTRSCWGASAVIWQMPGAGLRRGSPLGPVCPQFEVRRPPPRYPMRYPAQETVPAGVLAGQLRSSRAGFLSGQQPRGCVERQVVADEAKDAARRHLYPAAIPQASGQVRGVTGLEVGPVPVDDHAQRGGHRLSIAPKRGEQHVLGWCQRSEVVVADGVLLGSAVGQ